MRYQPLLPPVSVPRLVGLLALWVVFPLGPAFAQQNSAVQYNRDVLPILAEHCFTCHGFDKGARQAGLRLDSAGDATAKLESGGHAVVPGDSSSSQLVSRIFSTDPEVVMPPAVTGKALSVSQKEILRQWIQQGAAYEPHWAFVAPRSETPPTIADAEHPIDCFIRERLVKEDLEPSREADRATLIRRLTLDLTGLPPTVREVREFLSDDRPEAYDLLVQRLLTSEHFGERWARWWLDLAHYADSDGYLQDFLRPVAWRYRQWVVEAFQNDLPFDRFTIEQLAGDLLPDAQIDQRIATGFLRNTLSNREGGADLEEYRVNQVIDRTMTTGTTWLGLTVGCAQCHDHKFDPVSQREFYQLYAFFNEADEINFDAPLPNESEPWQAARQIHDQKRVELLAPVADDLAKIQADWERRLLDAEARPDADFAWQRALEILGLTWGQGLGEGQLEGVNIIRTPLDQRSQVERDRLLDYFLAHAPSEYSAELVRLKTSELLTKLQAMKKDLPPVSRAPGMMQTKAPRETHIHLRGEFRRKGERVRPSTPAVLPEFPIDHPADRLALARWLVSPNHPLTARVTVNRIWQELFGRGIVATSENFGIRGERPSHPELLDWLAMEFQRQGWSIRELLRTIVTSQTYRQSSRVRSELLTRDPDNRLLARQNRLRLSAEAVRDSALAVSGLLTRTIGGPSVRPPQPESVSQEGFDNKWEASTGADRYRRGLYTFLQRTSPFAQFVTFDLPDTSRTCTRRERSNSPIQALTLLNDPVFFEAAQALGRRILMESSNNPDERLQHAFHLALARPARPEESQRLLDYLRQQQTVFAADSMAAQSVISAPAASPGTESSGLPSTATTAAGDAAADFEQPELAAWITLSSVLLNLDEFVNRE